MNKLLTPFLKYVILPTVLIIVLLELIILYGGRNNFNSDADYIVVLGAKLHGDKPSKSLVFRMDKAIYYLKKYPDMKLIATGGQGSDETIPEGVAIRNYCLKKGIESSRILVEKKSENTFENLKFSRNMINKNGPIKINIVSNNYHILRSKMLAKRCGFIPYGIPSKTPKTVLIKSYLRESLALVKSYIFDRNIKKDL